MYTLEEIDAIVEKGILSLQLKKEPKELYDPIEYIISIGGKRIRPRLCLLASSLFSDICDDSIIYPALGLEIFHAFTLIHDDIMDRSDLRRGQLTIHKKWNENIAILSGDVMSILAYRFLCQAPADRLPAALQSFIQTGIDVCEGQQLDMNYEDIPVITMDDYLRMIGLKTSALLAGSARLGAILGGAEEKKAAALHDYGYLLGLAFQITDDYLDTFGDPAIFGKKIGEDITNNKKSWLYVECSHLAQNHAKEEFDRIMSMDKSHAPEKIEAAKDLYERLGVRVHAEKAIEDYFNQAIRKVEELSLGEDRLGLLWNFARQITYRKK